MDKEVRRIVNDATHKALIEQKKKIMKSHDYKCLYQDILEIMDNNNLVIKVSPEKFNEKLFEVCARVFVEDSFSKDFSDLTDTDPRDKILEKMEGIGIVKYDNILPDSN